MDIDKQRIQDDLRGRLRGEVLCDPLFTQMYATDASIYAIEPLGVVRPKDTQDVAHTLQYALEHQIPIHPRGAGTGLAGGCLGSGLVLDFSRFMRHVIREEDDSIRVEAGMFLADLNQRLANRGRQFGPDPAAQEVSTIGSAIAVNGSGSHWPRYRSVREHVLSLQVVLANGEVLEIPRGPIDHRSGGSSLAELTRAVAVRLETFRSVLPSTRPKSLVNSSGYHIFDAMLPSGVDLIPILVGSEGTLAVITAATVSTVPLPKHSGVALLFFDRLEKGARAALELPFGSVAACDLMDRRLLSLAREADNRFDTLIPDSAEGMLLIEVDGTSVDDVREQLREIVHNLWRRKRWAFEARIALDSRESALYWRLVKHFVPTLYRVSGASRPLPFVEDMAVPPDSLPDAFLRIQNVLKRHQVTASFFAHATHGQLHIRPFFDLTQQDHIARMHNLACDLYREINELGGTISGEHGDGLSRSWYLREQFGPVFPLLQEIKRIFDPTGLLNPGKVADSVPVSPTAHLRTTVRSLHLPPKPAESEGDPASEDATPATYELMLNWNTAQVHDTVASCNGCGRCRTQSALERMCPIFRIYPSEEASPRAKANLLSGLLTGHLDRKAIASDELRAISDLCINCHQCRLECPASVDIPRIVLESKAQHVELNGLSPIDWWLGRLDSVAVWLSRVRPLANLLIANRRVRWLLERTFGLSRMRKLPRFEGQSFLQKAARRQWTRQTKTQGLRVVYFTDLYANWFDVQLAEATVAVLQHNGVSVYVHPRQVDSGMALVSAGAVQAVQRRVQRNTAILADAIRQGYHVVTAEPSSALCLTREYPNILDNEDVRLVTQNTSDVCAFLWGLHQQGKLELDFHPINLVVGYHLPCHMRVLTSGAPGESLLKLIPGIHVQRLDKGCSGMAGTYGLKAVNFRKSIRAGWPLIRAMRDPHLDLGATECCACKMQMEQGTTRMTLHPIKLLAHAYRLMPDIEKLLARQSGDLIVT
jgi:FAD/FMN-containing dehydrogenase/Fe-S oxidoreductase